MIVKLKNHPYSNCHVEVYENIGAVKLVSYGWYVAVDVDENGWMSCRNPFYSRTTCKQVGWFLREYFPELSYQFIKRLYENGEKYNVYTGEIVRI